MKVAKSYFPNVSRLYFANAYGYIDSISGGAGAAKRGYPIILVSGNTINNSLKDYIRSNRINVSYILDGERAVSKAFENSLKNAFGSTVNSNRQRIVEAAYKEIGKPYKFGASGPNSFDCSGLVRYIYIYRNVTGINLPHNSQLIANAYSNYKVTSIKQMKPGDIVCYGYGNNISHVGIYIGNGKMIDAPDENKLVSVNNIYSNFAYGLNILRD